MEAGGGRARRSSCSAPTSRREAIRRCEQAGARAFLRQAHRGRAPAGHARRSRDRGRAGRRSHQPTGARRVAVVRWRSSIPACWTNWRAGDGRCLRARIHRAMPAGRGSLPASGWQKSGEAGDWAQVREHAHALKGVAEQPGLVQARRGRQRTDAACRTGNCRANGAQRLARPARTHGAGTRRARRARGNARRARTISS